MPPVYSTPSTVDDAAPSGRPFTPRAKSAMASTTRTASAIAESGGAYKRRYRAWTKSGTTAARGMPTSSSGVSPEPRAMRKNSHAASAEMIARSAASAAPPAKMTRTPRGAAMTPNRTRRVSSDTKAPPVRPARATRPGRSHFHDLGFFRLDQVVDLVDVVVVNLLQLFFRMLDVILGDALQLLERFARVGTRVPNGDLPFLGELVDDLRELLAALLVHRRQGHPDDRALRGRIEAEIGFANRLLDDLRLRLVERRHDEKARLGRGHRRD